MGGLLAGCGDGDASGPCGPVRREPLDRRSHHVLPGAEGTEYQTDPPTSGPHLASPGTDDVLAEPLSPEVQVGLLEEGTVLLQHHGLDAADRRALEALAGDGVVVAPAAGPLDDDAVVVATAWITKQACSAVDVDALAGFAGDHRGGGPGGHG